jgi:hypothetical protein
VAVLLRGLPVADDAAADGEQVEGDADEDPCSTTSYQGAKAKATSTRPTVTAAPTRVRTPVMKEKAATTVTPARRTPSALRGSWIFGTNRLRRLAMKIIVIAAWTPRIAAALGSNRWKKGGAATTGRPSAVGARRGRGRRRPRSAAPAPTAGRRASPTPAPRPRPPA